MELRDLNIELCRDILNPRNARFASPETLTAVPMADVEEVVIEWPVPSASDMVMCKEFLRHFTWPTNADTPRSGKKYVEGDSPEDVAFTVDGEDFYGRWRQSVIRARKREVRRDEFEHVIQLTLRKGYVTAYALSDMRVRRLIDKEGNAVDIDGKTWTATTTSANPGLFLFAEIPNVARESVSSVLTGLPSSLAAATEVDDYTVPTGRTLYKTVADAQKADDGSMVVTVIYADEQFAFNGYESSNTTDERSIGYLWNVPRQLAETISDEWYSEADTARRGCTAGLSGEGQGYLNLILTARSGAKDNLTTMWVPISCDTYERYHFAWGYTKAELYDADAGTGFFASHDSDIGDTEDTKVIRSRRVTVQQRGDALYDAIITERSWANSGENSTADFTVTVPIGTKITRQTDYGYNFSKTNLNAIKTSYDTTAWNGVGEPPSVGITVDFRVTREDDCSFDYVATIVDSRVNDAPIDSGTDVTNETFDGEGTPTSTEGEVHVVEAMAHATPTEIATALSEFAPAIGQRLRIELSANDDETFGAVISEVQARSPEDSVEIDFEDDGGESPVYTGYGTRVLVATGHNVEIADLTTAIADLSIGSGARKSFDVNLRGNDDGGWDYTIVEREVQEVEGSATIGTRILYYGLNVEAIASEVVSSLATAVPQSSSIAANNDGTINYSILTKPLLQASFSIDGSTDKGKRYVQEVINSALIPTPTGERVLSASFSEGDNGNYNGTIVSEDIDATTDTISHRGGTIYLGTNADSLPVTSAAKRVVGSLRFDDYGKATYQLEEDDPTDTYDTVSSGSSAFTKTVEEHAASATGPADGAAAAGTSYDIDVTPLLNGKYRWRKVTMVANELKIALASAPAMTTEGYAEKTEVARNAESLPTDQSEAGKDYLLNYRITDEGRYDYELLERDFTNGELVGLGELTQEDTRIKQSRDTIIKTYRYYDTEDAVYHVKMWVWRRYKNITRTVKRQYVASFQTVLGENGSGSAWQTSKVINPIREHLWAIDTVTVTEGEWTNDDSYGTKGVLKIDSGEE